jgi:hypothetical protein
MNTVHLPDTDASPLRGLFEGEEPRTNLLELAAGEHVPDHRHPDRRILFYVIERDITLRVGEETASLTKRWAVALSMSAVSTLVASRSWASCSFSNRS